MAKLLERGARWMRGKLPDAAAVSIQVRAGTEAIEAVDAIPGRRDFQQYLTEEAVGTAEVWDWVVAEQDLVFPIAGKIQPADGWEISFTKEDETVAVFIVRPGTGARVFDTVDPYGLMYRVHTKFDRIERP